jgi:DNA-binding transcriptional regulator LsrR (DeoR family)
MIRYATLRKWIIFRPPPHLVYTYAIKERYDRLTDVEVVRTTVVSDVARRAAEKLVKMLQGYGTSTKTVHIGLSGGLTMREFASAFAEEICQPTENLPKKIVLHGLVAGFDPDDPTTVPSAFYTYFLMNPVLQIEAEFKGFNATPMVKLKELDGIMDRDEIRDAHAAVADIDIFVTTGADCREHSTLFKRMEQSPASVDTLNKLEWIGDIFWRPIGTNGPIMTETDIRAMTLLELDELPALIANNKKVLLVLGPCPDPSCNKPKDDILAAVLNQKERYITHLVVDSRTGGQFVNKWIKNADSMR